MDGQAAFYFAEPTAPFRADDGEALEKAKALRQRANELLQRVGKGGYSDSDLELFWELVGTTPALLFVSPRELSTQAGLGTDYFTTVYRERRHPKLHNFLRALSAIVAVADDRLGNFDPVGSAQLAGWRANPLVFEPGRLIALEEELRELIRHIKSSNALSDVPEIDAHWKKSLIALLETTLEVLKAPLVETTLLRKAGAALMDLSKKAGSDARTAFITTLAASAATALTTVAMQALK